MMLKLVADLKQPSCIGPGLLFTQLGIQAPLWNSLQILIKGFPPFKALNCKGREGEEEPAGKRDAERRDGKRYPAAGSGTGSNNALEGASPSFPRAPRHLPPWGGDRRGGPAQEQGNSKADPRETVHIRAPSDPGAVCPAGAAGIPWSRRADAAPHLGSSFLPPQPRRCGRGRGLAPGGDTRRALAPRAAPGRSGVRRPGPARPAGGGDGGRRAGLVDGWWQEPRGTRAPPPPPRTCSLSPARGAPGCGAGQRGYSRRRPVGGGRERRGPGSGHRAQSPPRPAARLMSPRAGGHGAPGPARGLRGAPGALGHRPSQPRPAPPRGYSQRLPPHVRRHGTARGSPAAPPSLTAPPASCSARRPAALHPRGLTCQQGLGLGQTPASLSSRALQHPREQWPYAFWVAFLALHVPSSCWRSVRGCFDSAWSLK